MFQITQAQMDELGMALERRIERRLAACVTTLFPQQAAALGHGDADPARFADWLHQAVAQARRFNVEDASDQAVFLTLAVATQALGAPANGVLAFTRPVLRRRTTEGSVKMAWIEHRLNALAEQNDAAKQVLTWVKAARAQLK